LASKYRRWWAIFKEKCRISPGETDRLSLPTHPKAGARVIGGVSRLLKTGFQQPAVAHESAAIFSNTQV
jgi:hypothetical protein